MAKVPCKQVYIKKPHSASILYSQVNLVDDAEYYIKDVNHNSKGKPFEYIAPLDFFLFSEGCYFKCIEHFRSAYTVFIKIIVDDDFGREEKNMKEKILSYQKVRYANALSCK